MCFPFLSLSLSLANLSFISYVPASNFTHLEVKTHGRWFSDVGDA
jgi:hypothetical protein